MRVSRGPCPICGAEHSACKPSVSSGAIAIPQLPARDAMAAVVPSLASTTSFSTATYKRKKP